MFRFKFGLLVMVVLLVGCIKIPIGDGNSFTLSKDGVTVEDEEGKETKIQYDEDQINITGGEGEEAFNISAGLNTELPDGFPSEVPLTDDAMIIQSGDMSDAEQQYYMITYQTKNPIEDTKELYRNYIHNSGYVQMDSPNETDELFGTGDIYHGVIEEEKYIMVTIFEEDDADNGEVVVVSLTYATME